MNPLRAPGTAERQGELEAARCCVLLKDAGWHIQTQEPFDASKPLKNYDRCAIEEYQTDNGPADYALCIAGQIIGMVEAKKWSLGPQNVLSQAELYSRALTKWHVRMAICSLKPELQGKLQNARRLSRCDLTKRRVGDGVVRKVEIDVVDCVEGLGAELNGDPFGNPRILN